MGTENNVDSSDSFARLSYRQADLMRDCNAWQSVPVAVEVAGQHLPMVGFDLRRCAGAGGVPARGEGPAPRSGARFIYGTHNGNLGHRRQYGH